MRTSKDFVRRSYRMGDGEISALHFGNMSQPVRLIFLHANGFNAQTYRAVLAPLSVHTIAIDLRGHGQTTLPYTPARLKDWYLFRDDVLGFIDGQIQGDFILAGHSLGACVGMLCAPFLTDHLKGYVGFDPVTMPIWMRPFGYIPGWTSMMRQRLPIAVGAGRRRADFESPDEAFSRYKGRSAFKYFPDDVLRDYLEGGLKKTETGVTLACDPRWEQAIYAAHRHNLFKAARSLPKENSRILYAGKAAPHTPTARERMRGILGKDNVELHKMLNHMFPLNDPNFATQTLQTIIDKTNLSM